MKYNGIIKKEIKDYAKGILNSNDEGKETQELCFEAIRQIQAALIETRQPFLIMLMLFYLNMISMKMHIIYLMQKKN